MISLQATLAILVGIGLIVYYFTRKPTNSGNWSRDLAVLPGAIVDGSTVTLKNVRDIKYRTPTDFDVTYRNKTFSITDVDSVWFGISKFWPQISKLGLAHTFLSFGLKDGSYISVSAEVRRHNGEFFSATTALRVLFRQREIIYVVATEHDIVGLRVSHWKESVHLYPLRLEQFQKETLLNTLLARVHKLHRKPEFFHLLVHNCTSNVMHHLRNIAPALPYAHIKYIFPATVDKLLYDAGLIDTELSYEDAQKHFSVTNRAQNISPSENLSEKIRAFFKAEKV